MPAHDDVKVKGIQIIAEREDCETRTLLDKTNGEGRLRNPDADGNIRCARTLIPPDSSYKYLPDITYTLWKCGFGLAAKAIYGSIVGCKCGIPRIVTVPADSNQAVAMEVGESLSANACNANCARELDDKCWVCTSITGENGWTNYYRKHKVDLTPFMLGVTGTTKLGCLKTCHILAQLPYELKKLYQQGGRIA